MRKNTNTIALFFIACIVILYALAARDGHNWKGDFSQYIMHAQNLVQGIPYTQLGVLSIDGIAHAGTPPGYPLIIAPIIALLGLNFIALKIQMAVLFGLGLWVYWKHIQNDLPIKWALCSLAFLAFTPWILKFSNNLLTDIPYLTASLFALFWAHKFFQNPPHFKSAMIVSTTIVLACSFRSIGIVIVGTMVIYAILFRRHHLVHTLGIALVSYICITIIYFSFEAGGSYASQFSLNPYIIAKAVWQNLVGLERSFTQMVALYPSRDEKSLSYNIINKPILIAYCLLMFLGLFRSIQKRGFYLHDLYMPLSLIPLLIYPYPMRARYLLPLLPFAHAYTLIGFRYLLVILCKYFSHNILRPIFRYRHILPVLLWLPLFFAYWGHYTLRPTTKEANVLKDPDVQSLFQEIHNRQTEISCVLFWRPRILRLFTPVQTAGVYNINQHPWTLEEIAHINRLGVSHIILDPHNPKLATFTTLHPNHFKSVFKNDTFHLMQIIPSQLNTAIP